MLVQKGETNSDKMIKNFLDNFCLHIDKYENMIHILIMKENQ